MKLILPCLLLTAVSFSLAALEPGEKAPPFANPNLTNRHIMSRDYLGKGWVLIDFFATDCEGCRKELPILERLQQEMGPNGPTILVFATDPGGQAVLEPYFLKTPTTLLVLVDRYQIAVTRYGVNEIPSLFLINPAGIVVLKQVGFHEGLYERLRATLPAGK